ncbi:MAG TPA: DUF4271 domain-containing protein [Chitinophagaceae bacterium]|nr:DUF4271 domain-containing protein [Chitinophagaceae bacterium]
MIRFLFSISLLLFCFDLFAQQPDSAHHTAVDSAVHTSRNLRGVIVAKDTAHISPDTMPTVAAHPFIRSYQSIVDSLLRCNQLINITQPPVYFTISERKSGGKEMVFYSLCAVLLIFGLFKTFYNGYYNNLFRVFFNTSIRQTQLTDQLLQAKLPSFILNIFFAISIGFYLWLLLKNYHPLRHINNQLLLPVCIAGIGVLYFVKYAVLKFVGWLSGMSQAANSYIFVIFLMNKVTGIVLLPFIILLAFLPSPWTGYITLFSVLTIGLFFLARYVKAFSFLEYRFPMEPLHFLIYVVAMEALPILILYKVLTDYLIQ